MSQIWEAWSFYQRLFSLRLNTLSISRLLVIEKKDWVPKRFNKRVPADEVVKQTLAAWGDSSSKFKASERLEDLQ